VRSVGWPRLRARARLQRPGALRGPLAGNGDLDFNDQAIAYNYEFLLDASRNVVKMKAVINVLAVGASLHNGIYLHLRVPVGGASIADQNGGYVYPMAGETDLVVPIIADSRTLFPSQTGFINTKATLPIVGASPLVYTITFTNGAALEHLAVREGR
jgi:LruC domain-containing protein